MSLSVCRQYPSDEMTLKIQEFQSNEMWQHNPANDQQGRHTPGTGGGPNMKSTDSPSTSGFANARGMAKIMALMARRSSTIKTKKQRNFYKHYTRTAKSMMMANHLTNKKGQTRNLQS